ncbi:hypothetical protein [Hydrogenobaculum acidophilum]
MKELVSSVLSALAAITASLCCFIPLLLSIGISTSSSLISSIHIFDPYRIYLLIIGYIGASYSIYRLYIRKKNINCACEESWVDRFSTYATWISVMFLLFVTFYPLFKNVHF